MEYPLLTPELARQIEFAEAQSAVSCADTMHELRAGSESAVKRVCGGFAIYCGAGSPVTQAVGLGLDGPVSSEEFDQLEGFYFSRKEPVRVETCPMADASLFELFGQRGYRVTEFSNVMVRPVCRSEEYAVPQGVEIRRAGREELGLWTLTVAQGFAEYFPVTRELLDVMKMFALSKGTECYLARIEGRVAGGATLAVRGKIAGLFGASTLPDYRRRGVQTALLEARLRRAAEAKCDVAVSLAQPGSASNRNIARRGFQTLYTRVKFERAFLEDRVGEERK
jgi:GNAT superfamily N-acetyltransferase